MNWPNLAGHMKLVQMTSLLYYKRLFNICCLLCGLHVSASGLDVVHIYTAP